MTALISDLRVSPPIIVGPAGDNVDQQRHRLQQGVPVRRDAAERPHSHPLIAMLLVHSGPGAGPGPLIPIVLLFNAAVGLAHDPGLSSLEVSVSGTTISATLRCRRPI